MLDCCLCLCRMCWNNDFDSKSLCLLFWSSNIGTHPWWVCRWYGFIMSKEGIKLVIWFFKKKKHKKEYSFGCSLSLVIQKGSDGISLKLFSDIDKAPPEVAISGKLVEQADIKGGDSKSWSRVPYLPSYIPFGQVYIMNSCFIYLSVCFSFVYRRLFLPDRNKLGLID